MDNPEQREVLDAFKAFPQALIYTLGTKEDVLKGFDFYKKKNLFQLGWNNNFSRITAKVANKWDKGVNSVNFFLDKSGLAFTCTCSSWKRSSGCEHIICAIMTIKNLLQPEVFHLNIDEEHREKLLNGLLLQKVAQEKKEKHPDYSILLEKNGSSFNIQIMLDGERITQPPHDLPSDIGIFYNYFLYSFHKMQAFSRYLKVYGNKYPILFRNGKEDMEVMFDASLNYSAKTELDASRTSIRATRKCFDRKGSEENLLLVDDHFAIDLPNKLFGPVKDKRGWEFFNGLRDTFVPHEWDKVSYEDDDRTIRIPIKTFQMSTFVFPSSSREKIFQDITLRSMGRETTLNEAENTHRLTIMPEEKEDTYMLRADCYLENLRFPPYRGLFEYIEKLEKKQVTFLWATNKKVLLYEAFFSLLPGMGRKEAEKIIHKTLSRKEFSLRKAKKIAHYLLTDYLNSLGTEDVLLTYHHRKWYVIPLDKEKQALLYKIPYDLFGKKIFKGMKRYDQMILTEKDMEEKFLLLYERLKEHGIDLYYMKKPVEKVKWDFTFDADRPSGIDWFEIRPEITYNGKPVDDSLWMEMLNKKGMVEKEDSIQILDSNSRRILNTIANVYRTSNLDSRRKKEIIRIPRLQILDWIALRNSGVTLRVPKEDEEIIERLTQFKKIEKKTLPEGLKAKLRSYQKDGYYWLSFLYEHRFGACLADDMGLGKTIQAISLLAGIKEGKIKSGAKGNGYPHLIVVPPSLLFNWENELQRFYPDFSINHYTGKDRGASFKDSHIVLTTYGLIRMDIEKLKDVQFDVIIFDEAQAIKNIYADTTGAVRKLRSNFKLTLTGTPLENHIGEYYSIIDLAIPGLLGEFKRFKPLARIETSPELDILIKRTTPFVLRRTKEKILKELPPKIETDIYLDLTENQKALYKKTVEQVKSTIEDAFFSKTESQAQIIALTAILKLRQLCVSPQLLYPEMREPSPKIDFLIGKLKELLDEEHSALVFSQFTSFLNLLEKELRKNGIGFLRLDGKTPVGKRKSIVQDFQSQKGQPIFLLSLKAGGQGLNLTKASYVFHLDPWWNPAVESQASDRAHRIGQRNKVTITRILMRHTIEEKMMELKKKKLDLYRTIMDNAKNHKKGTHISRSDFDFILS